MFIIAQFPFADLRQIIVGERGRLGSPDWSADDPKGFVRGFGKVFPRNSSGLGLVGESHFADMGNAIRFPEHIEYGESEWICMLHVVPWFRRLYFDGQIAGRFEIGFLVPEFYEDLAFSRDSAVSINPAVLAQRLLTATVQINSVDGSKQTMPFARCAKALGMAYLAATTSNAGLRSYPLSETIDSFFFVGDPFVTIRIASERPISDGRDRRYLTSHNEPALFITSARGSDIRNNVIVQASEKSTKEETPQERVTRVLFAHLNSLIFAYAHLQKIGTSIAGQSSRDILRTAVMRMIERLAKFRQNDARNKDAAFSEGLHTFANAYAGRVDELAANLETLATEWSRPTNFERFRQYFKGVHDLVIKTSVEKTIDLGMKGGI